ncbi:MAG: phosphonate ABC transporter ATP-binding protein [Thermoanaerobaculia bacterium]|nr:phosphonate ABC transporter ATP-binding protein [Thermoanaerobaculia bacterium]
MSGPSEMQRREAVRIEGLSKVYDDGTLALDGVDLTVYEGEFLVVLGLSGSGKSTLLRCVNRLIEPTEGRILIHGEDMTAATGRTLRRMRSDVAMIFQQFNLVRRHTVLTNVLSGSLGRSGRLGSYFLRFSEIERKKALEFLERVGLEGRDQSRADALSGGQQQRVAIARALMQEAKLVLADEPVASLDPALRHSVMRHIEGLNRDEGMTVMCTLHDIDLVRRYATRLVALRAGRKVWEGTADEFDDETFLEIYGQEAEPAAEVA